MKRRQRGRLPAPPLTVGELLERTTLRLERARLHYGHGTDNAKDDEPRSYSMHSGSPMFGAGKLSDRGDGARPDAVEALVTRRISERIPSAYLTGVTWFAGHRMRVTPDVLVPRSPIAELANAVSRHGSIPTRSGACSTSAPVPAVSRSPPHARCRARIEATDVSPRALRSRAATCGGTVSRVA